MRERASQFLKKNRLSLHDIHRQTGISMSTLSTTFNRPFSRWKVGIVQSLADMLHISPGDVVNALSEPAKKNKS